VEGDFFVGSEAEEHRGIMKLSYPMEHGVVTNWNDMEKIWSSLYDKNNLACSSEEHPVLLTEAPLNPRRNREKAAEIFFETFGAPALFVSPQATLSLYSSGRTTGVVLDSGDGVTHAVPVYEGFSMSHAITRMDVAGRDVTEQLQRLLRRAGYVFHTTAEREVVRSIKENICYVAFNPVREEEVERDNNTEIREYKLPDGKVIKVGPECFRAPEILFNPSIVGTEYGGVHECLVNAIFKSDLDLRKKLFGDIVLAGGSTMFPGYGDRLLKEVKKMAQSSQCADVKIKISAPPNRQFLTWMGGSILASLAAFKNMYISKKEYEEEGSSILHRRSI
jgi:centractin